MCTFSVCSCAQWRETPKWRWLRILRFVRVKLWGIIKQRHVVLYAVLTEILYYRLSLSDLGSLLDCVGVAAAKWKPIGIALNFDPYVLEIISTVPENIVRGPQACFSDLLTWWLKWAPPPREWPTLATLVAALRSEIVEEFRLAAELERNFKGKWIIRVAQTY